MNLQELRDRKGQLANEANAILTKSSEDGRMDLRKEEEEKFDAIHVDIEKLTKQIERQEKQDALMASIEDGGGRRSEPNTETRDDKRDKFGNGSGSLQRVTNHDRAESLRTWLMAGSSGYEISAEQRERARRCGVPLDSNRLTIQLGPAMKANYWERGSLRPGDEDLRAWKSALDEDRAALTGLQTTTTTGGYTTADETMRALEIALLAYGGMRTVATVIRTATGGPLPIPTTNDTANKGEIIAENITSTELEMVFGQLVLDAWKYSSKYILASMEFLQDTSINAAAFLGDALGTRIARITNDHFTTGTGSQPNGIITASTSSAVTLSGVATASYDNIVDLVHTIDPAYRTGARFMFHDGGLKMLKKIKVLQYSGDTVGVPLWMPGLAPGQPDTIFGFPYTINQSMTTPATGVKSLLFGDFSKYIIRDVKDVTVLRLDERFAEFGQVAFLAFSRHDGDLLDAGTHPVKYATQA